MLQNNRKAYLAVCDSLFGEFFFLLIFIRFYWFDQKKLLKQIQIFLRICLFSNMVRKTIFLSISVLISEIVILCLKRKALYEFIQKCFKKTERPSLAVCGSLCGEIFFFVNIYPLLLVWSKKLFKQIQIFLRICPYQTW